MDREREMKLPIYIEAAMGVFLVVILAMAGKNGMIPQNQKNNVMKQSEVCMIIPKEYNDTKDIAEILLSGKTVVLNMEAMNFDTAQRVIDFTSGACFTMGGNLQKISNYIFLVTPTNVDISGDLQDLLSGSMETPSVRGRY